MDRVVVEPLLGLYPAVALAVVEGRVARSATALEAVDSRAQDLLRIAKGHPECPLWDQLHVHYIYIRCYSPK